jgi:hypothetical protein
LVVRFDNRDNKSGSWLDIVSEMHWLAYFNLEPAMSFWLPLAGEFGLEIPTIQPHSLPQFADYKGIELLHWYYKSETDWFGRSYWIAVNLQKQKLVFYTRFIWFQDTEMIECNNITSGHSEFWEMKMFIQREHIKLIFEFYRQWDERRFFFPLAEIPRSIMKFIPETTPVWVKKELDFVVNKFVVEKEEMSKRKEKEENKEIIIIKEKEKEKEKRKEEERKEERKEDILVVSPPPYSLNIGKEDPRRRKRKLDKETQQLIIEKEEVNSLTQRQRNKKPSQKAKRKKIKIQKECNNNNNNNYKK